MEILRDGIKVHGELVPEALKPFHDNLVKRFAEMTAQCPKKPFRAKPVRIIFYIRIILFNKIEKKMHKRVNPPTFSTCYSRLDFTFHIGSTPTFLYFDLCLNTAYAAHHGYFTVRIHTIT